MQPEPDAAKSPRSELWADFDHEHEAHGLAQSTNTDLRRDLYAELIERGPLADVSVPVPHGPYEYYARQERDSSYPIYCRRPVSDSRGPRPRGEEILLDVEALAEFRAYCAARIVAMAPDHSAFVYAMDEHGDERWDLWYRDLEEDDIEDRLIQRGAGPTAALALDGRSLFYTLLDSSHRPWRLVRRDLFDDASSALVLFEEADPAFGLRVSTTESEAFVILSSKSTDTNEIHYLPADRPTASLRRLHKRVEGVRYALCHWGECFYVLSNQSNPDFDLWEVKLKIPERDRWRLALSPRQGVSIERVRAFEHHLVLQERTEGATRLTVFDPATRKTREVSLPDTAGVVHLAGNREYATSRLRFAYSSLTTPYSIYEHDLRTRQRVRLKQGFAGAGFDRWDYVCERWTAKSKDGCPVPISLVYRKDCRREGGNPLVLHGYGAYGYCLEPEFDPARLSLLDRGVIYAIAHVRGGGELGPSWHQSGRRLSKRNSIDDFLACAHELVWRGYAASGQLAALGESAGGLLVAAAMHREPELFAAVVADCPFIDVIGTLEDDSLPLTVSDWQEWGDPAVPAERFYMESYAPMVGMKRRAYPSVLVLSAINDPWAPWRQAVEWALSLSKASISDRPILLHIDRDAGHKGPSSRGAFQREVALKYAFLLEQLGVENGVGAYD